MNDRQVGKADLKTAMSEGVNLVIRCQSVCRQRFVELRAGEPYNWTEFDRKYVVKPSYDYACGYPLDLLVPDWDPDFSKRRPT